MRRINAALALTLPAAALVALALLPPTATTASAQARRMSLDDLGALVRLADPQIAPDGKAIIVVVSRPNYDDNRHDAELVLIDVATGGQRVLTRNRRQLAYPRWSPTGDRVAFLAEAAPRPKKKSAGAQPPPARPEAPGGRSAAAGGEPQRQISSCR
jgi:dipeptidyl aminopeptidase/acylaminoacyl peptidase